MIRNSRLTHRICHIVVIGLALLAAWRSDAAVVFTNTTVIASTNLNYENADIVASACTVTLQGVHRFGTFTAVSNAVVNQSGSNLTLTALNVSNSSFYVAGGGWLSVSNTIWVGSNGTVYCLGTNTTSTNGSGLWVGSGVTITASNVTVDAGGKITADGQGYASVGSSATGIGPGGSGTYGGGSHGGAGGQGNNQNWIGAGYGSASQPVDLGSSGGSYSGNASGAGGGAIRLNLSGTLMLNGTISANGVGGASHSGAGAGGSLWVTTAALTGAGKFTAKGGNYTDSAGGAGGGGRIAIYYANGTGFSGYTSSTAAGGIGWHNGSVGTVAFFDTSVAGNALSVFENFAIQSTSVTYGAMSVSTGATVTIPGGAQVGVNASLWVASNATIYCLATNNTSTNGSGLWVGSGVTITASNMTVDAGAKITADGQGYVGTAVNESAGVGPGTSDRRNGGSYGGVGGFGDGGGSWVGSAYGASLQPTDLGSSGGTYSTYPSGAGGGAIRLIVSGQLTLNGTVTANGLTAGYYSGCGAGGSVWVTTAGLAGSGTLSARGGSVSSGNGGGGGGGRIAVYYAAAGGFTGWTNATVVGGTGNQNGGVGSLAFIDTSVTPSRMDVYQGMYLSGTNLIFTDVTVHRAALLTLGTNSTLTANTLLADTNATIAAGGGSMLNVGSLLLLRSNAVLNCQSINNTKTNASGQWVGAGVTISASNLTVDTGAKILADGQGYVGTAVYESSGVGPGASDRRNGGSSGGAGGLGNGGGSWIGSTYGSSLQPTDLGSSGGTYNTYPSGAGGGAVRLIVSGVLTLNGMVSANGWTAGYYSGCGAGGSLWVTTAALAGNGTFSARGGNVTDGWGGGGGGGRIAVYYLAADSFTGWTNATVVGGTGNQNGAKGTLFVMDVSVTNGILQVYDNITLPSTGLVYRTVNVYGGATLSLAGGASLTVSNLWVASNATVLCQGRDTAARVGTAWAGTGVTINADSVLVDVGGRISADAQGYLGGQSTYAPGAGPGGGQCGPGGWQAAGGGYGGPGGLGYYGGIPGALNGAMFSPTALGSGGASDSDSSNLGGTGGGAFRLNIRTSLINNGIISANGGSVISGNRGGAGSGGSVWIFAPDLAGSGWYRANGGNQVDGSAAGGGGGRLAFNVSTLSTSLNVQCLGGASYAGSVGDVRGSGGGSVVVVYSNASLAAQTNIAVTGSGGGSAGVILLRRDSDGDGLADSSETDYWHTDPALTDTDGDGVPDNSEAAYGSDPTNAVSLATSLSGRVLYSGTQTGLVWVTARDVAITNMALRTSGTGYVNIGDKTALRMTNAITMSAWINLSDASGDQPILVKEGNGKCSYWFGVYNYRFGLLIGTGPGWGLWARSSGSVSTGVWTHVASTWDKTNWCNYLNGVLVASGIYTGTMLTSTAPTQIGQNSEWASTHFHGMIDEVRIWNRALTADEIQSGMFRKLAGTDANLAGYWNFDSGAATDLTTNANPGTLVSDAVVVTNEIWGLGAYRTQIPTIPADYRLENVLAPATYTVSCFRDFNLNGVPEFWESQAAYAGNPLLFTNATTNINMTLPVVVPPTANAAGPYSVDEFTGNAYAGAWSVALDGSASIDNVSGSTLLTYAWDLGTDGFNGTNLNYEKWIYSADGVSQSNAVTIVGNGSWGPRYFFSRDTCPRAAGMAVEYKVKFTAGESMLGFKNTTDSYYYSQLIYGLYFYNYGIAVHEDGTSRGWSGWSYLYDTWYDIRIELKETQGARYFYRRSGDSAWNLIYDSTYSTATIFRRGLTVAWGTCTLDDMRDLTAGNTPSYRFYGSGTRSIRLVVTDPTGLQATNDTTVTTLVNAVPVANILPSAQTQYESNAVDSVWTFPFAATNSTDDHGGATNGIYKYEWDWAYDGSFDPSGNTSASTTHSWTNAGTYVVAVRVTDHVLQSQVTTATVTVINGAAPIANPGGPYSFDEFTGNASNGAWNVVVSGTNSYDNESSMVQYRWNLGTDVFQGTNVNTEKWILTAGVSQSNQMNVSNAGYVWGTQYLLSKDIYSRVRGMSFQATVSMAITGDAMVGWHNTGTAYGYQYMPYTLYFGGDGQLRIYEDGTSRGTFGTYTPGVWYDVRIDLKPTQGAQYFIRTNGAGDWALLYDSAYGTANSFRRGADVYHGTLHFSAMQEIAAGKTPTYRLYTDRTGTNTITLTVWDQALNTNSASTTVTLSKNNPPVAVSPGDKYGSESNCVQGLWSFTFQDTRSTDDHGIYRYEWDWNYVPALGFRPSGNEGSLATHAWDVGQLGTHSYALRVSDHLLQTTISTGLVVLAKGGAPTAEAGSNRTAQVGAFFRFNGTGSYDDVAVARYAWNYGDGNSTENGGPMPEYHYNATGTYTVVLTVYDGCEQASAPDTTTVFVVTGTAPVADAGGPYLAAANGPPAYFDARNASSPSGGTLKYFWDANIAADSSGDGNKSNDVDRVGMRPFYTYTSVGVYTAKLTVVDGAGQTNSSLATVTVVENLAPNVLCVPYHGNGNLPHPTYSGRSIRLKAVVRDAGTVSAWWLFGDGATTAVAAVSDKYRIETTHAYTGGVGQVFSASLIVKDSVGLCTTDSYQVVIMESNQETRAQIAVDEGLWWLHKDQNKANGRWQSPYGGYYASADASALQAFEINGHRQDGVPQEDPYVETVDIGLQDLFTLLRANNIGASYALAQPQKQSQLEPGRTRASSSTGAGNGAVALAAVQPQAPGTLTDALSAGNTNGLGVDTSAGDSPYELGMVMDAIAASHTPSAIAATGPAGVQYRTYYDLLQDMVDMYAWGQSGNGGWRYGWQYGSSDNSISQWAAIGIRGAEESFGINCPQPLKNSNKNWLNASWNGHDFAYDGANSYPWGNPMGAGIPGWFNDQPSAMVQMSMDDIWTTNSVWQRAEEVIAQNWTGSYGSPSVRNYYGRYAFTKAMRLARPSPQVYLQYNGFDWYNDPNQGIKRIVTDQQDASGYWSAGYMTGTELGYDLSTSWAIVMLTPALFTQPPVAVITAPSVWGYDWPLSFTAERSHHTDTNRVIVKYEWYFDGHLTPDFVTTSPSDTNVVWTWSDPHSGQLGDAPIAVSVRLKVTDDGTPAQTDETIKSITIAEPPHAPYANAGGNHTATEMIGILLNGGASYDIDPGDSITQYQWDFNNDNIPDVYTNVPTLWHVFPSPGTYPISLRVVDNGVLNAGGAKMTSEWDYVSCQVAGNLPPVANAGGPYTVYEGQPVVLVGTNSYDPNGDALTFQWDFNGDGVADATTALATNTWETPGITTARLVVSDTLLTSTATVSFLVQPINDAPSFEKGADQFVNEDAGAITVAGWAASISAGPPDEAGQILTFTCSNNAAALFSSQPALASNGTLTFTPAENANGIAQVSVYLSDNGGTDHGGVDRSAAQTFQISIAAVNDAPMLSPASPILPRIWADNVSNPGLAVSNLIGSTVTDVDDGALQGIAVFASANGNSQWQYSTNAGATWSAVGTVSANAALLLRSQDWIRYLPDGHVGTTAQFSYFAWDQTSGSPGATADVTARGGITAFSLISDTASITVDTVRHVWTVASDYGTPSPARGTYTNDYGTVLTTTVSSPDTRGLTQYVCRGWTMAGCLPLSGSSNTCVLTLTNNAALTWQWQAQYWLALATSGSGALSETPGWKNAGSNVVLLATPDANWIFDGWTGDTNGCLTDGQTITVPMDRPRSIAATFLDSNQRMLTVVSAHGGATPGTVTVDIGSLLAQDVTNSPVGNGTTQYVCTGATVSGNEFTQVSPTNVTLTLTNNATLTWQWQTQYWLSTATNGGGTVSAADGWFVSGSSTTLTATAGDDHFFSGWSGDTNGCVIAGVTITVPMSQSRRIVASFEVNQRTLNVLSAHGGALPGTTVAGYGTLINAWVTNSPVVNGTTQYVCLGATVAGNDFIQVYPTNVTFTLTNNATLTWLWATNYWLGTATNGAGAVVPGSGWQRAGSNVIVRSLPTPTSHLVQWTGDTNGCVAVFPALSVPMTRPRNITAVFTAGATPLISGTVTRSDNKAGLAGALITFAGGAGSVTTDSSGNYSMTVPYGWSGNATASFSSGGFAKPTLTFKAVTKNQTKKKFVWTPDPVISGTVTRADTKAGLAGVTITANNSGGVTTTDGSGNYSLTVPYKWTGVVTPSLAGGGTFKKPSVSYSNLTKSKANQKFVWTPPLAAIASQSVPDNTTKVMVDAPVMAKGFAQWALVHGLVGNPADLFDQDADGDGIYNGAEYAFGDNLLEGEPLVRLQEIGGRLTAEVPAQDPGNLLDACVTVEFTCEGSAIFWFPAMCLPPQVNTPPGRQWFQATPGNEAVDFRVRVQQVR